MNQTLAFKLVALIGAYFGTFSLILAQQSGTVPLPPSLHGGNPQLILDLRNPQNSSIKPQLVHDYRKLAGEKPKNFPSKRSCATMEVEKLRRIKEAGESLSDFESWLQAEISTLKGKKGADERYTLPVVVHIIYGNEAENISLQQVQSQIAILNQDYSRSNEDRIFTQTSFQKVAANTNIQFQLAKRDPQGRPSNGINRISLGAGPFSPEYINNVIKPNTIWNPSQYLNIWVCNIAGGTLGFSQFPNSSGLTGIPLAYGAKKTDGVVVHYQAFGNIGTAIAPFNLGRTATHEIGHWLGLLHIWGDEGCEADDYCADTPPLAGPNYACDLAFSGCTGGEIMTQNFMDYSEDACMSLFTLDQKARMRAVLQNSPRRNSLLRSSALQALPLAPSPDFIADIRQGCGRLNVKFSDLSDHEPTKYSWVFEGGKPARSSAANPAVTYRTPGIYAVSLTVSNAHGQQSLRKDGYIQVRAEGEKLPLFVDFEVAIPEGSEIYNPGQDSRWRRSRKHGGHGRSSASLYFDNYQNHLLHTQDWFLLPIMDFEENMRTSLRFDVAYAPYGSSHSDTLGVFISTACGSQFHAIYYKGGEDLGSTKSWSDVFEPKPTEWRTEAIDLSQYANQSFVQIAFVNFSGGGNNIYLDNIRLESEPIPAPVAAFKISRDRICAGELVTFTDVSDNSPTHWRWSFPGAKVASDSSRNPSIYYPRAGIYDVSLSVRNASGQHTEFKKGIIEVLEGPELQVFGPDADVCPGEEIELRALGGSKHRWVWGEERGEASGPRISVTPTSNQVYQVTAAAPNGCKSSASIEVRLKAEDRLEITPAKPIICQGESVELNASGADEYRWTPTFGLSSYMGAVMVARPEETTTYTLKGEVAGCIFTREVTIEIQEAPGNVSLEGLKKTICEGEEMVLRASGAANYQWFPQEGLNTDKGDEVIANPLFSTTYTLLATSEAGCQSEYEFEVAVVGKPQLEIRAEKLTVCKGEGVRIQALGASNYRWFSSSQLNNATDPWIYDQPEYTSTYTVIGSNMSACADTADITIEVQAPAPVHIATETTTICPGESTVLTASGAVSYRWSPSIGLDVPYNEQVVASPSRSTRYTLEAIDRYGCKTQQQVDIGVATNAPPRANFAIKKNFICVGEELEIEDFSINAVQYFWVFPGGEPERTSERFPRITYQQAGTYDVILVVQGCEGSDRIAKSEVITVSEPSFLQIEEANLSICRGESLKIVAHGAAEYRWFPSVGLNTSVGPAVTASPKESMDYQLIGTDWGGCADTLDLYVEVRGTDTYLSIYPPASSICEGESVELIAEGAEFYTWRPTIGISRDQGASIYAAPLETTVYTVKGEDSEGCIRYGEVRVEVKPSPKVEIFVDEQEICEGEELTLRAFGADVYQWEEDPDLSRLSGAEVLARPIESMTYYVKGTNDRGCSAEAELEVVVHPKPELLLLADETTICLGDTLFLQASGAHEYSWMPDAAVLLASEGEAYVSPTSTLSYRVKGTTEWGCSDETSLNITVVKPEPLHIFPESPEICAGEKVSLTASGGNGSYFWEQAKGLSSASGATVEVSPQHSTTYSVRSYAADLAGCVNSTSVTVRVKKSVGINLISSVGSLCEGDKLALQARGGDNYRWLNADLSLTRSVDGVQAEAIATTNRSYRVTGLDVNGCRDTATIDIQVVDFEVGFKETSRRIDLAETGGIVHFNNKNPEASRWLWTFAGDAESTEQAPTHIYSLPGVYRVDLNLSNDVCTKNISQDIYVSNSSRLDDLQALDVSTQNLSNKVTLSFSSPRKMYLRAKLLDENAKELFSDILYVEAGAFSRTFDLNKLGTGAYKLVLTDDTEEMEFELRLVD